MTIAAKQRFNRMGWPVSVEVIHQDDIPGVQNPPVDGWWFARVKVLLCREHPHCLHQTRMVRSRNEAQADGDKWLAKYLELEHGVK